LEGLHDAEDMELCVETVNMLAKGESTVKDHAKELGGGVK